MKVEDVNKYVNDYFSTRGWYRDFFEDVRREYHSKQKPIQDTRIVDVKDFIEDIEGNLGYYWGYESLVPQVFVTYDVLAASALRFSSDLDAGIKKINQKYETDSYPPYFMVNLQNVCYELSCLMLEIAKAIVVEEGLPIPYLELRNALNSHNLHEFVKIFNATLSTVAYQIRHDTTNEAYFHICTHLIIKLLHGHIESEESTDGGRIDSVITTPSIIYILEYKYSRDNTDRSGEALQQIKDKSYADSHRLEKKLIYGVGFSFGETSRKIDKFTEQQL